MDRKLEADAAGLFDELQKFGRVAVYEINFDTGKSTIRTDSTGVLNEVKKLLTEHKELHLMIEGHTDNVGKAATNKKLSDDRAASVKDWLVRAGVPAVNLSTSGFGDTKSLADNSTEEGRAKNRRVELVKK